MLRKNKFVYLFLVDLARINFGNDYKHYSHKEFDYANYMLRAYITAFNTEKTGTLTEKIICNIHKDAMAFKPDANSGNYKNDHNKFAVFPSVTETPDKIKFRNCAYSITNEGLAQFVNYWLKHNPNPNHIICFEDMYNIQDIEAYAFEANHDSLTMGKMAADKLITHEKISFECGIKIMQGLLINYECRISPLFHSSQENQPALTSLLMKEVITNFNKNIMLAITPDEKIRAIATYVQLINQIHPFNDGNIRVCYILINKLLRDHELSLTLVMNPNRLDACSIEQVVQMIKEGQTFYQQFINHADDDLLLNSIEFGTITCKPQILFDVCDELIDNFIHCVIQNQPQQPELVTDNQHFLFSNKINNARENLILTALSMHININDIENKILVNAIKEEKFNLALRYVCANYKMDVITTLLKFNELSFDPMKKSSNNKTAFDWLNQNNHLNPNDKEKIKNILSSCMTSKPNLSANIRAC